MDGFSDAAYTSLLLVCMIVFFIMYTWFFWSQRLKFRLNVTKCQLDVQVKHEFVKEETDIAFNNPNAKW